MKINSPTLIYLLLILTFISACNKKEVLDPEEDYILMRAFESTRNQSDKGIDIEALENSILLYEERGEKGKVCLCNAFIGYKLFADGDFDKSLIHLKKAEANLEYCDSMSSFVYSMIVNNTKTTDTILALSYAKKALEKDLEYNNLRGLPYSYMDLSLLSKGDSARYYLEKSIEYFDDWGDNVVKCKYAWWHRDELHPDTMIAYAKPCYDSMHYTGHARILAEAYLRKGEPDSVLEYIEHVARGRNLKPDYYYYNSRMLSQLGRYEEANKSWEKAYELIVEDFTFMFSQRLSAINGEYDLLNAELQNEKKRVRTMRMYNIGLMVLVALLGVAIILIKRYKRDINELEIDIAKRKERFNTLFEKHKSDYIVDKNSAMTEAMRNLEKLHEAYPSLTRTEITIIWLVFMKCTSERICELLSITQNYYYQRKSAIYRTLGKSGKEACDETLEKIVKEYITI